MCVAMLCSRFSLVNVSWRLDCQDVELPARLMRAGADWSRLEGDGIVAGREGVIGWLVVVVVDDILVPG
jgi:hypothetical protein